MQQQGFAGETKAFGFNDTKGNTAKNAPSASTLKEGVGEYVQNAAKDLNAGQSAVFGVSIMDGYHTMTLSVSRERAGGISGMLGLTNTTYTLSDQGTMYGTAFKGNLNVAGAAGINNVLTNYVKENSDQTTRMVLFILPSYNCIRFILKNK